MKLEAKFKTYDRMRYPMQFLANHADVWIWVKSLEGSEKNPKVTAFFFDDSVDHIEFDRREDEVVYKLKFGHLLK